MNTVKINKQEWLEQNLNIDHFRNGDTIIQASTKEAWKKAAESGTPAWCYYGYKAENGKKYGRLYNWFAVNDSRGLAPEGFKIATLSDWSETNY